jgi:hypothetical protein
MDGWVLSAKILEEIANPHHDLTTSRLIQSLHLPPEYQRRHREAEGVRGF